MLSITAPTDVKSKQALELAEKLATGLSDVEVARAKKMAQALVSAGDGLRSARYVLDGATEAAKQAAADAVAAGITEVYVAEALGVTRLTVRKWIGK